MDSCFPRADSCFPLAIVSWLHSQDVCEQSRPMCSRSLPCNEMYKYPCSSRLPLLNEFFSRRFSLRRCGNHVRVRAYYVRPECRMSWHMLLNTQNGIQLFIPEVAAVFRTKILHVYGLNFIRILFSRGEIPQHTGNSPGNSARRILVCEMLT